MEYFVILICLIGILINRKYSNRFQFTDIIFGEFLLMSVLYVVNIRGLYEVSQSSFAIIFSGLLSIGVGAFFGRKISIKKRSVEDNEGALDERKHALIYVLYAICIYVYFVAAAETIRLLKAGYSMYLLRTDPLHLKQLPGWFDFTYVYFVVPLSYILIGYGVVKGLQNQKRFLFLSILIVILATVSNGGRIVVFFFLLQIVYWRLYYRDKDTLKEFYKKHRTVIIGISIALFVLVVVITRMRGVSRSILGIINDYTTPALQLFDARIKLFDGTHTYGFMTFRGWIDPLLIVLKRCRIISDRPFLFSVATETNTLTEQIVKVGPNSNMNAFVTLFYAFFVDFGVFGVILFSFFYGALLSVMDKIIERNSSLHLIMQYSLMLNMVFMSFVRWQPVNPAYALSFVYCFLVFFDFPIKIRVRSKRTL